MTEAPVIVVVKTVKFKSAAATTFLLQGELNVHQASTVDLSRR